MGRGGEGEGGRAEVFGWAGRAREGRSGGNLRGGGVGEMCGRVCLDQVVLKAAWVAVEGLEKCERRNWSRSFPPPVASSPPRPGLAFLFGPKETAQAVVYKKEGCLLSLQVFSVHQVSDPSLDVRLELWGENIDASLVSLSSFLFVSECRLTASVGAGMGLRLIPPYPRYLTTPYCSMRTRTETDDQLFFSSTPKVRRLTLIPGTPPLSSISPAILSSP